MDRTSASNYTDIGGGRRGYRDRNLVGGIAGTGLIAADRNAVQEEIMAPIEAAGLTGSASDFTQLLAAIRILSRKSGAADAQDTGTANAMVASLTPAPATLSALAGAAMRIKKASSANTGAVTLNLNGLGAAAITFPDGTALSAGDLPANAQLSLVCSGTAFVLVGVGKRPMFPTDITSSLGSSGYELMPSGRLLQWGQATTVSGGGVLVTLPVAFPNAIRSVSLGLISSSPVNAYTGWNYYAPGGVVSKSQFSLYTNAAGAATQLGTVAYQAIGD